MNKKYISIQSILFDLSLTIDEKYWDENRMLEWAIKGFRRINTSAKYENKVAIVPVVSHKATLPCDLKYVNQIAYKAVITTADATLFKEIMGLDYVDTDHFAFPDALPEAAVTAFYNQYKSAWRALQPATSSFFKTVNCQASIPDSLSPSQDETFDFTSCKEEYHISPDLTLTTSFSSGLTLISYLGHIINSDGDVMIPDDEVLKDALYHWCMYRYWESKAILHESAAPRERQWHLSRYSVLAKRAAGRLNTPDIGMLENIKNNSNRLIKKSNQFSSFFMNMNTKENLNF